MLTQQIDRKIIKYLQKSKFLPGTRLKIDAIANNMKTSHIPVRESLARIAHNGIVLHRPRYGYFIPIYSEKELKDLYEYIYILCRYLMEVLPCSKKEKISQLLEQTTKKQEIDCNNVVHIIEEISISIAIFSENHVIVSNMKNCIIKSGYFRRIQFQKPQRCYKAACDIVKLRKYLKENKFDDAINLLDQRHKQTIKRISHIYSDYTAALE